MDGLSLSLLRRSSKGFATRSFLAREYSNIEKPQLEISLRSQASKCMLLKPDLSDQNALFRIEELCVTYYIKRKRGK